MRISRMWAAGVSMLLALAWAGAARADIAIQHWQARSGARVYYVEAPQLPLLDVRVVFDAGSAREAGKAGLAQLTNTLLDQGAGELSADQIAERLDSLGAQLSADSLRDMALLGLRTLSDEPVRRPALELMAQVLAKPRFAPEVFERERQRVLVGLDAQEQSPGAVAGREFMRELYGTHPYASPPEGTRDSLAALTPADAAAFHRQYYTAANAIVAIVGAVSRAQAEGIAEALTAGLPPGGAAPALPPVPDLPAARTVHIERDSAQTHIYIGQPVMARGDPDHFPLTIGNHTLGGSGLVSRLSNEVREKRGLAYSVYSYFQPMRGRGPLLAVVQTKPGAAAQSLQLLHDNIRRYVAEGSTPQELEAAQKNLTGGFALNLDSNKKILDQIASIGFYGLPLDWLDRYNARVLAVKPEDIRRAFAARVQPDRLLTVIVGPKPAATTEAGKPEAAAPAPGAGAR